ncbi:MAG: protein kinase [Acidobacteria bacterium]|nr:protein kinase [Acidobacteriota bacterium]
MNPERTIRLRELFERAVELDTPAREALLSETLAVDEELGRELQTLLRHDGDEDQLLDRPAASGFVREPLRDKDSSGMMPELPGYRILSRIGAGGMGEVFLAEDETLRRRVALKLLPERLSASAESLARFKREARAASALNHPGIMTVHEIGSSNGVLFIAAEYIEGVTLRERLAGGPLPVGDVLRIGIDASEALSAAHDAGIVHRDIKPENLMVRRDGYLKVLDFGLAKNTGTKEPGIVADETAAIETDPGRLMGTVAYMSPEQLHAASVDARTDVWSLGVVLYELVNGTRPFKGTSTAGTIHAVLSSEVPPREGESDPILQRLDSVIRRSLEKDAARRFDSAREMCDALRSIRSDLEFETRVRLSSGDSVVHSPSDSTGEASEAPSDSNRVWWRRRPAWIASTILIVALSVSGAVWLRSPAAAPPAAGDSIRSIAVLPFLPLSSGSGDDALELGMADTLITKLGSLDRLDVRPLSTVRSYRQPDRDPVATGRSLGVAAVLDGTVQQAGDRLRVNVRLLRVRDGAVLWSSALDKGASDIFDVQDTISEQVLAAIRMELSGEEQRRVARRGTERSEAYLLYLKGRYFLDRRGTAWRQKGVEEFSKAVELDPVYAPAYAGLSDAYAEMVYWGDKPALEYMPKARAAAEKALDIDDGLAEAHTSLGAVLDDFEWKFAEAEWHYRRAIELNPKYALAHQRLGQLFAEGGRFDEAKAEHRIALELEPLSLNINMSNAAIHFLARDNAVAIEYLNRTLDLDPDYGVARGLLGWIHVLDGRPEEAVRIWLGDSSSAQAKEMRARFETGGIRAYFARDLELAFERQRRGEQVEVFSAMELAYLGRKDEAFAILGRAFEQRNSWLGELNVEPSWDPLRSDPRFGDLARRIGLPQV